MFLWEYWGFPAGHGCLPEGTRHKKGVTLLAKYLWGVMTKKAYTHLIFAVGVCVAGLPHWSEPLAWQWIQTRTHYMESEEKNLSCWMTGWSRHHWWLLMYEEYSLWAHSILWNIQRKGSPWFMNSPNVVRDPHRNQPSPARKTSGWFNPQVGLISSPSVADAAIPGAKTWDHLDLWFTPSFGPGPLLFLRSFCRCDVLLLVLDFANMDVSSLGKFQWCFNYGCNIWTVDISTKKTYLAC